MDSAIRFKFGTQIKDGLFLRLDYKLTPIWAWLRSCDRYSSILFDLFI